MTVQDGALRSKPKSIVIQNTLNASLKEKSGGVSFIIIDVLHGIVEDAGGDLMPSFKDIRLVRVAPCVVAVRVMPTEPPEAVSSK